MSLQFAVYVVECEQGERRLGDLSGRQGDVLARLHARGNMKERECFSHGG